MSRPAYMLAGGRSRRMGRDKARVRLDEETTLIEAVAESIDEAVGPWCAVADRRGKYGDLGFRTIADEIADRGPVGGLARAARDVDEDYFFVTSCDRVGLRPEWVRRLEDRLDDRPAAVSFVDDGRREPLFGFYRADLAGEMDDFLEAGGRAVWRFLVGIDALGISAPDGWNRTVTVNTPGQLERARKMYATD